MRDIYGRDLWQVFAAAIQNLGRYRDSVNALKVFLILCQPAFGNNLRKGLRLPHFLRSVGTGHPPQVLAGTAVGSPWQE